MKKMYGNKFFKRTICISKKRLPDAEVKGSLEDILTEEIHDKYKKIRNRIMGSGGFASCRLKGYIAGILYACAWSDIFEICIQSF